MPVRGGDAAADAAIRRAAGVRVRVGPETALQQRHHRLGGLSLLLLADQVQRVAVLRVGVFFAATVGFGLKRQARKHQDVRGHDRHDQRHGSYCTKQSHAVATACQVFLCPGKNLFTHCASASLLLISTSIFSESGRTCSAARP